jgi:hypothetical protein
MRRPPAVDRCRFCGCSEFDACAADNGFEIVGCHWIDRTQTVCSACAPAAKAETLALRTLMRAGYRSTRPGIGEGLAFVEAFHLGFVVGWFQISKRSPYGRNPFPLKYSTPRGRRLSVLNDAWYLGRNHGAEASRSYQRACGPLTNAPRRAVLRVPRGTSPTVRQLAGSR